MPVPFPNLKDAVLASRDMLLSGAGNRGLNEDRAYPYLLDWELPPTTSDLNLIIPKAVCMIGKKTVTVEQFNMTAPVSKIIDLWIKPDGTVHQEVGALDNYTVIPRFPTWLHLCRVQTNAVKVEGVWQRGSFIPVLKEPLHQQASLAKFVDEIAVPTSWVEWTQAEHPERTILRAPNGDLYRVTTTGVTDIPPLAPVYNPSIVDGVSGFEGQPNGTAIIEFVGRDVLAGAWKSAHSAGIRWYFTAIAAGILSDVLRTEVEAYLLASIKHLVRDWVSGVQYQAGMKVGGSVTQGFVWEAQNTGTTTATPPFISGATIGTTTVIEGDITWKAVGLQGGTAQWYWMDSDPTLRLATSPDSHDSYAACFVWVAKHYCQNSGNTAWLTATSVHDGYTNADVMKEVIYANLMTQVDGDLNLTKTFQEDQAPWGGTYAARYLMDNCEAWAGFNAAASLFGSAPLSDAAYKTDMLYWRDVVLSGILGLYQKEAKAFRWINDIDMVPGPDASDPNKAPPFETGQFYPWVMSQAWMTLWDVPIGAKYSEEVFVYAEKAYPAWWYRNDIDDSPALGASLGYYKQVQSQTLRRQILERVEQHYLIPGAPPMWCHDYAYFLLLRDYDRKEVKFGVSSWDPTT